MELVRLLGLIIKMQKINTSLEKIIIKGLHIFKLIKKQYKILKLALLNGPFGIHDFNSPPEMVDEEAVTQ